LGLPAVARRFLNDANAILDDRIGVVGRGLLGLTITCARCHDHKFDPIPTEDYYSLHGVFASSIEPDELPVIGVSEHPDEARDFDRQLREREAARDAFLIKTRDEYLIDIRARFAAYLRAAFDLDFNGRSSRIDERSKADGLNASRVRALAYLWQEYLNRTRTAPDSIAAPWHAFAALPADGFAPK